MRWSGAAVGLLSLVAVVSYSLHEAERPAPGPLHPSHAQDGRLGDCHACHVDGGDWVTPCGACHEPIVRQLRGGGGVHGALGRGGGECARCHVEHHGADVPLVGEASFRAAGVASRAEFDHERDGGRLFPLSGRHDELECIACHVSADAPELAFGERRFLGQSTECAACHDDAHDGSFGTLCESCHGQDGPFADAAGVDHTRFPLLDAHADVACATCHAGGLPSPDASSRPVRACVACHESPHDAAPLFLADAVDCARCHDARSFEDTLYDAAAHASHGVPLNGRHAEAPCAGCHESRRLTRDLESCIACHDDVHAAGGAHPSWPQSRACSECHDEGGFAPSRVNGASHSRFANELSSAHAAVACAACHDAPVPPAAAADCAACHASPHTSEFVAEDTCVVCHTQTDLHFRDAAQVLSAARHLSLSLAPPHDLDCADCHTEDASFDERFPSRSADDCAACHDDPHEGEFASGPFREARCTACHGPTRFSPSSFSVDQHARTAMALDGGHAAVPCAACHPREGARRRFAGSPTSCAGCHDDPHAGTFDRSGLPPELDERTGCARCHDTVRFRDAGLDFDHGLWTGHPLTGAHARAACGRCHERERGGALGSAPTACSACHSDPHRGQLRRGGSTDCARCHEQRESFTELRFDHSRDTRFPLDASHAELECSACHRPVPIEPAGESVILYRPVGTECRDCHLPSNGKRGDR